MLLTSEVPRTRRWLITLLLVSLFLGIDVSSPARATPTPQEIAARITQLTGLSPQQIDQIFAAEQAADIVMVPYEVVIPIVLEPRVAYLLIRVAATGQWIRLPIESSEWHEDFRPYLEAFGVEIHQQPKGTIDQLAPLQEAAQIAAESSAMGGEVANVVLYGQVTIGPAGRTVGTPSVSSSGEAGYAITIDVPKGAGVTPELTLTYGHRSKESVSGVGWGIGGLSQITRCGKTYAQNGGGGGVELETSDRYCLDGKQLRHVSGAYGSAGSTYRIEVDLIARVSAVGTAGNGPAWFKLESKDGLIYEYGNSSDSRIESLAIGYETTARSWALSKIEDRSGNQVLFYYEEDGSPYGAYRIDKIEYGLNPANGLNTPSYEINLAYENQPAGDVDTQYGNGAEIRDVKRLDHVDVLYQPPSPNSRVRRYELAYETTLSSTSRSRLESIQECAGVPLECFEPTVFAYTNGVNGFDSEQLSGATIPTGIQPLVGDFNGDGRTDLAYVSSSGSGNWVYQLADSIGGYASPYTTSISNGGYDKALIIDYNSDGIDDILVPQDGSTWWVIQGSSSGVALQTAIDTEAPYEIVQGSALGRDLNGDGRHDLVWMSRSFGHPRGVFVRYRDPTNGFSSAATTIQATPNGVHANLNRFKDERSRTFDADGDGLEDFAYFVQSPQQGVHNLVVHHGNGTGVQVAQNFNASTKGFAIDVNGDGYTDLGHYWVNTYGGASELHYRLSTGENFAPKVALTTTDIDLDNLLVVDWDSDGYEDMVAPNTTTDTWFLYRSTGQGFSPPSNTGISVDSLEEVFATDSDGDGLTDIAYKKTNGQFAFRPHSGAKPDLLKSATDAYGDTVEYEYLPITDSGVYQRYATASFPEQDYQAALYVVSELAQSDGIGGTYSTSYQYEGAQFNRQGRGINGFAKRIVVDDRNGSKSIQTYKLDFPFRGRLKQADIEISSGTLVRRITNIWDTVSQGSGNEDYHHPYVAQVVEEQFEGEGAFDSAKIREVTTTNKADGYGTIYEVKTETVESASANGAQPGTIYTEQTNLLAISNNVSSWCIGKPDTVEQINDHTATGGSQITRTVSLSWNMVTCRQSQVQIEPGDSDYQVTIGIGYDGFGNINSRTATGVGMAGRTTTIDWGTSGQFPVSVTNPLGQTETYSWDYAIGRPLTMTDPNGIDSSLDYDAFGRVIRQEDPEQTFRAMSRTICSSGNNYCGSGLSHARSMIRTSTREVGGAEIRYDENYFDEKGRAVQSSGQSLSGALVHRRTIYDQLGRVHKQSSPSFSSTPCVRIVVASFEPVE